MVNYFSGVLRFQWRCCSADATLMTGADIMTTINHLNFYGVLMPQALAGVLVHPAYIYVGQPQEMVYVGRLKTREMTSRERTSRDQVTGTDIARKDIARTTQSGVDDDGYFWRYTWLRLRKLQRYGKQYYMTICYPLSTGK